MPPAAAFKSVEMFDYDALKRIVSNWDVIPIDPESKKPWTVGRKTYEPLPLLNKYMYGAKQNKMQSHATFSALYYYSENSKDEGRRYVKNSCGMQMFSRQIRQTLAHRFYDDIDIKNCHPTILLQYAEKKGYDVSHMKKYVQDRDAKLSQLMSQNNINRDKAKQTILAILNGGTKDYAALVHKPSWLNQLVMQIDIIQKLIVSDSENERFVKRAKKDNKLGSTMNHLLCSIEDKILSAAISFLESKNISTANLVLAFDGFMLPKNSVNLTTEFFEQLSQYVYSVTQYRVEFCVKHMDEVINLDEFQPSTFLESDSKVVEDDNEAADVFIEMYSDIVKKSGGRIFVFNHNNTWSDNIDVVHNVLLETCLQSKIFKNDAKGNPKAYSGNVSGAKHVIEAVKAKLRDDPMFTRTLWEGSLRKLFFADGYWDFSKKTFVKSIAPKDSLTTIRMPYAFPEADDDQIAAFKSKILDSIFASDAVINTYLAHISRAVAGHFEDKHWVVGMGERNSGKGVLVTLNECVFQNYCITLNSDSFLLERNGDGDQAKKLSWLMDCEFKRLMFTNEITVDNDLKKVNGNMIKGKLASGGDTLKARRNYCNETEFKIQGRLFMLCNDLPPITPPDAAETMNVITFPYQFVEKPCPDLHFQKKKDDSVKDYVRSIEARNAYIHLVLRAYSARSVKACEAVVKETAKFQAEVGDEWSIIKNSFVITNSDNDRIASLAVKAWLKENNLNMSSTKLRTRLEKLGAIYVEQIKINGRNVTGYKRLKLKTEEYESEDGE